MSARGGERLSAAFAAVEQPLFVPYVMGGYPDLESSGRHAALLARHAGVLELGVPFSDPLADGPTIQAAGALALAGGARPEDVIDIAAGLPEDGPPVALMTYYNAVLAAGPRAFLVRAAAAGVAAVIVPDLPIDEAGELRALAERAGVALVPLAAPTSSDARLGAIARAARGHGFVYCVAVTGVTGGEVAIDEDLRGFLARARGAIDAPLAVGFGVRTPAQAAAIGALADGVVIASQLIRLIEQASDPREAERSLERFAAAVVAALAGVTRPSSGAARC